ncbi:Peptidase inhibitor I78 family protein [compost metagenome]
MGRLLCSPQPNPAADLCLRMSAFSNLRKFCLPAAVVIAASLSGCLTTPGPTVAGDGRCDATKSQWAVGQPGNEANIRRLKSESGAGLLNPIGPSTIVSMDIRQDRLRVFLDAANVITAVRCE